MRTTLLGLSLTLALLATTPGRAMDHGWDPTSPYSQWVASLLRPDRPADTSYSCCGKGDMYGIRIEQDALGNDGDAMGTAVIIDGEPLKFPDGSTRPGLKAGTMFRFPKAKVNPLTDGNPTATAHAFLSVQSPGGEAYGTINGVWCVIPLPPGV